MSREQTARLMRLATYASVSVASILIVTKLAAWYYTDSISLLSTLIDSVLDALASLVNLVAVRHALVPADAEHRFGHGKAEPLAALGQAAFIAGSAIFLVFEAGHRLYEPRPVVHSEVGIAVMIFAIALTFVLVRFQAYVVRKTGSLAIKADSLHYIGDLLVNSAVIVALLLVSQLGWGIADPLFGLAIAAYILRTSWVIARQALDMLMDRELPDGERERIEEIVKAHPKVTAIGDLRTRAAGPTIFINLALSLDAETSLRTAHDVAHAVEADLRSAYPNAEILIHQEPCRAHAVPEDLEPLEPLDGPERRRR